MDHTIGGSNIGVHHPGRCSGSILSHRDNLNAELRISTGMFVYHLDDPPPEHLGGHALAPCGLCLSPHDPFGEDVGADHHMPQQHLGQGRLVCQQSGEHV